MGVDRAPHRLGPPVEPLGQGGGQADRGGEGRPVEAGDDGLGHVGGGADHRGRRRQLEAAGGVAHDGIDGGAQHLERQRAGVGALQGGDGGGHGPRQGVELGPVDQRRRPCHRPGLPLVAQGGDDGAAGHEVDRPHRHPAQPQDAGAGALGPVLGPHGGQPAQGLGDADGPGRRQEAGRARPAGQHRAACGRAGGHHRPAGQRHRVVGPPAAGGGADRGQALAQLVVGRRLGTGAGGPHDHVAVGPRRLQAHLARPLEGAGVGQLGVGAGEPAEGAGQGRPLPVEVGHHLVALGAGEGADLGHVGLGLAEQPGQAGAPRHGVCIEEGELGRRGLAGRLRRHGPLQLMVGDLRRRRAGLLGRGGARLDHHGATRALLHCCHVVHVPPALGTEVMRPKPHRSALPSLRRHPNVVSCRPQFVRQCRPGGRASQESSQ
jgi:hypothetical protein